MFGLGLLAQQTWQGFITLQQYQMCAVRPDYLTGVIGLFVAAYFVQMWAWALIMRSLHAPLSAHAVLKGYVISFLPRYIPGTVWGYLSRNEWLAQTHNVPYGVSTVASLVEAAMLLVVALTLGAFYWVDGLWKLAVAVLGIVGVGVTWLAVPWLAGRFGGRWLQVSQVRSQSRELGGLAGAAYVLLWSLQGAAIVYIGATLCLDSHIAWLEGIASIGLAWTIGFIIPFVPAGLGVREWSMSALLVIFSGLEPGQAALLAVLSRVVMICAELIVLLVGLQSHIQSFIQGRWSKRG
jgi:glycosyltransferase 2 family protein